jgi:hypothetical protein
MSSPFKETTPFTHNPFENGTFPVHFNKSAMDFSRVNVFRVQERTSQVTGLVIVMVLCKAL